MEETSEYVVVFGAGLTEGRNCWRLSDGSQRRIETAVDYMCETSTTIEGVFLLGGYSKWLPAPPPAGVREAGFMREDVQEDFGDALPIYSDEDLPSGDTFDGAINLATLTRLHDITPGVDGTFLFAAGTEHGRRIRRLSALAIGLDYNEQQTAFGHIDVRGEDSFRTVIRERFGGRMLELLIADIVPGDIDELRKAQDIMNSWMTNKGSLETYKQMAKALVMQTILLYEVGTAYAYHPEREY